MIPPDEFYEALGAAIKQRREALNLTQSDLGSQLGLSRTSVTNIERGRQRLLIDQFCRVSEALRCERDDLLQDAVLAAKKLRKPRTPAVPASVVKFVERLDAQDRRDS